MSKGDGVHLEHWPVKYRGVQPLSATSMVSTANSTKAGWRESVPPANAAVANSGGGFFRKGLHQAVCPSRFLAGSPHFWERTCQA